GNRLKMRWWLVLTGHGWRVYDLEDLDSGVRLSNLMAASAAPVLQSGRPPAWASASPLFQRAVAALAQEDIDTLEATLRQLHSHNFPPPMMAVIWLLDGSVHIHRQRPREALEALDRAAALAPDMPAVLLLRAV